MVAVRALSYNSLVDVIRSFQQIWTSSLLNYHDYRMRTNCLHLSDIVFGYRRCLFTIYFPSFFYYMYVVFSRRIIRITKTRGMKWKACITQWWDVFCIPNFNRKRGRRKNHLGELRREENNIKMELNKQDLGVWCGFMWVRNLDQC